MPTKKQNRRTIKRYWPWLVGLGVLVIAALARLPDLSHGMDQWDVVLYKNSLVHMHFYREAQWPLLLLFQKGLWLILPGLSAQEILSLTNVLLGAATLALFFNLVKRVTSSYVSAAALTILLYLMPLFAVYSVVGMQDMPQTFAVTAFVAALMNFIFAGSLNWLYATAAIAGLDLGVRPTLILVLPSLLAVMLIKHSLLKKRQYIRTTAAFLIGAAIGMVGDLFIPPLANSSKIRFFINQFHSYNPAVLGYFKKVGQYAILSGYRRSLFYWLPVLWFGVYLVSRFKNREPSAQPILALGGSLTTLIIAYGLNVLAGSPPSPKLIAAGAIVLGLCLLYELARLLPAVGYYLKHLGDREVASLALGLLILSYIAFNYVVSSAVPRYLLPIVPAMFVLMLLLVARKPAKSWGLILVLLLLAYWGSTFHTSQAYAAEFKTLDTRSQTAMYIGNHPGTYYNFDVTQTIITYAQSLGTAANLTGPFNQTCSNLNSSKTNYAIFYGPATPALVNSCKNYSFDQVANYKRTENIIEDSVGNVGFRIYRLVPTNT